VATVGPDFESILLRCLKADPAERYPSAAALAADLREFTRSAELVPEAKALRTYLDEPEASLATLRPRVADKAVARARQYTRHGQLARALAEIGHATAYVPNHAGADRLLKRLSAGRVAIKIAVVAVGLCAALGVVLLAKPLLTRKSPPPTLALPAVSTPRPVTAEEKTPQQPISAEAPAPVPDTAAAKSRTSRRPHAAINTPTRAESATKPVAEPSAPTPPAAPAPTPAPTHEVVQTHTGTIALFAKGGFCYPSLDDQPAGSLMPVFHDIAPGRHKVYSSRTQQSAKEFAGEVDLPPGAKIERTVTEQGGRFTLARPR
jgi:hypothetical protein